MIPSLGGMLSRWVEIRLISYFRNGYGIFFIRTRAQRTYCEEAWTAWSTQCQVSSGCWDYGKPCLHISALKTFFRRSYVFLRSLTMNLFSVENISRLLTIECDIGGNVMRRSIPKRHIFDAAQGHRICVAEISVRCIHISVFN